MLITYSSYVTFNHIMSLFVYCFYLTIHTYCLSCLFWWSLLCQACANGMRCLRLSNVLSTRSCLLCLDSGRPVQKAKLCRGKLYISLEILSVKLLILLYNSRACSGAWLICCNLCYPHWYHFFGNFLRSIIFLPRSLKTIQ